jgi:hypothetical protein
MFQTPPVPQNGSRGVDASVVRLLMYPSAFIRQSDDQQFCHSASLAPMASIAYLTVDGYFPFSGKRKMKRWRANHSSDLPTSR